VDFGGVEELEGLEGIYVEVVAVGE